MEAEKAKFLTENQKKISHGMEIVFQYMEKEIWKRRKILFRSYLMLWRGNIHLDTLHNCCEIKIGNIFIVTMIIRIILKHFLIIGIITIIGIIAIIGIFDSLH